MQIFVDRLKEGDNRLEFSVEEITPVINGDFDLLAVTDLVMNATRRGKFIYVTGSNTMKIEFDCDRCAETTQKEFTVLPEYVFHLGDYKISEDDEDDTTIVLPEETTIIDFSEHYLEAALLAVPYIRHCSEDCQGLCTSCGANLNLENCDCAANKPIDPRWQKLADIANKLDK